MSKTVVLVGGGTSGSVAPLLAVGDELRKKIPEVKLVFFGGRGIEKQMLSGEQMDYVFIPAGKWRRYLSLKNIGAPFLVLVGFLKSLYILKKFKPAAILGAGSFVQVSVMYAGFLLRIPVFIHQQDAVPGLANILCSLVARKITVSLEISQKSFSQGAWIASAAREDRVVYTGNPSRLSKSTLPSKEGAVEKLALRNNFPTLLVLGGGTGALALNELIWQNAKELSRYVNVLHLTGKGKSSPAVKASGYIQQEFSDNMPLCYAASDIVLCRAGFSTITELSILGKVAIVVPMPDSHQVDNARILNGRSCAVVLNQKRLSGEMLVWTVRNILHSRAYVALGRLMEGLMPKSAAEKVALVVAESISN